MGAHIGAETGELEPSLADAPIAQLNMHVLFCLRVVAEFSWVCVCVCVAAGMLLIVRLFIRPRTHGHPLYIPKRAQVRGRKSKQKANTFLHREHHPRTRR